jgi:hypothetical protein
MQIQLNEAIKSSVNRVMWVFGLVVFWTLWIVSLWFLSLLLEIVFER